MQKKVRNELFKLKDRPMRINVRSELLYALVHETLKGARCRLLLVKRMLQMNEVVGALISHLDEGGNKQS